MNIAQTTASDYVPLDLGDSEMTLYAEIAQTLDRGLEETVVGFMHAAPVAREAAAQLWRSVTEGDGSSISMMRKTKAVTALRGLLGLDPNRVHPAALVAAGLRLAPAQPV